MFADWWKKNCPFPRLFGTRWRRQIWESKFTKTSLAVWAWNIMFLSYIPLNTVWMRFTFQHISFTNASPSAISFFKHLSFSYLFLWLAFFQIFHDSFFWVIPLWPLLETTSGFSWHPRMILSYLSIHRCSFLPKTRTDESLRLNQIKKKIAVIRPPAESSRSFSFFSFSIEEYKFTFWIRTIKWCYKKVKQIILHSTKVNAPIKANGAAPGSTS